MNLSESSPVWQVSLNDSVFDFSFNSVLSIVSSISVIFFCSPKTSFSAFKFLTKKKKALKNKLTPILESNSYISSESSGSV